MTSKLFISYSHLDEKDIIEFKKHIAPLKQNGLISEWDDRKIISGEDFQAKIDENLEVSDIICLFISPNFLSSDACISEKDRSFVLRNKHGISIIPIILANCGWQDIKNISPILALPQDGKPVHAYSDHDEAWNIVYNGLKKAIEKRHKEVAAINTKVFIEFLNDSDMLKSAHAKKTVVQLKDIFIFPDLQKVNYDDETEDTIKTEQALLDEIFEFKKLLIAGESQSGKTTLCKIIYSELRCRNFFPIYVGDKTNAFDGFIKNKITDAFNEQYKDANLSDIDKERIVIIIDDFSYVKSERKQRILKDIEMYRYQVLTVDDIFSLNINDESITNSFSTYRIDEFSALRRDELIRKWIQLSDDKSYTYTNDNEFYEKLDTSTELIDTALGKSISKGIMPSYPVFILSILSSYETFDRPLDQEISSQGHCYQALIYMYLRKEGVKNDEIDIYINFLSVLAYHYFSCSISELSPSEFDQFLVDYNQTYYLPLKITVIMTNLYAHRMLEKTSIGNIRFFYPYLYYYFVAKYFADHISDKKKEIFHIIENLHKDENAYIAVFISHHTKNSTILDEIILNAMLLFEKFSTATLNKSDMSFFDEQIDFIAKAALPKNTTAESERKKDLELKNKREKSIELNVERNNKTSNDDIFSQELRRTIRTVEVMGIITKNRIGSLEKTKLSNILAEAINVNLRILDSFFIAIKDQKEQLEMIDYISDKLEIIIGERPEQIKSEKLEKEAKKIFWNLSFGVIFGILNKTIRAIGSDKLQAIIEEICNTGNSPAYSLIKHGVFMWYGKNINIDKIIKEIDHQNFSETAKTVLRYLVVNHCRFHNINFKDKQKMQSKLGISTNNLLRIEGKRINAL